MKEGRGNVIYFNKSNILAISDKMGDGENKRYGMFLL